MKGIETADAHADAHADADRSDHCPAMKGIETRAYVPRNPMDLLEATTAPQ